MNDQTKPPLKGGRCECPVCGRVFAKERGFNRHRVGAFGLPKGDPLGRRCMTVEEMAAAGLAADQGSLWRLKAAPMTEAKRDALRAKSIDARRAKRFADRISGGTD